ncbi:hypothetical protein GCM10009670_04490 [Citricoccus alkalitolerans]
MIRSRSAETGRFGGYSRRMVEACTEGCVVASDMAPASLRGARGPVGILSGIEQTY